MSDDPWEAATRAVECGGEGAVSAAKMRLAVADLLHVVREDRGGAWALCPLHRDTNPSLRVYADGHYHCFGCQAHGDVIDLYAALHQITNREAIAALAGRG
jgi:DNA primase